VYLTDELDSGLLEVGSHLSHVIHENASHRMLEKVMSRVTRFEHFEAATIGKPEHPSTCLLAFDRKSQPLLKRSVIPSSCGLLDPNHANPSTFMLPSTSISILIL
jgi:hypothetical protein